MIHFGAGYERRDVLHRWTRAALAVPLSLALASSAQAAGVNVGDLRMDNRADEPLGVDDTSPALSWKLTGAGAAARQTAYEVEATGASGAQLWDTGKVASSTSQVTYAGAALTSRAKVSWRVRVWDGNGDASD